MFATMSYALTFLLLVSVFVVIVKKLIIGNTDSDGYRGVVIPLVVILSFASIICCAIAISGAVKFDIKYMNNAEIAQTKTRITIALVVGYVFLAFNYIMLKIIELKSKNNEKEQPKYESRWDLDKMNKNDL